MNQQIAFSPADVITIIKSICYLITAVAAAVSVLAAVITKLKAPDKNRDKRLELLERRTGEIDLKIDKLNGYVNNDYNRFNDIEKENRIFQRGILALINHDIDGNNIEELKTVSEEIKKDIFQ